MTPRLAHDAVVPGRDGQVAPVDRPGHLRPSASFDRPDRAATLPGVGHGRRLVGGEDRGTGRDVRLILDAHVVGVETVVEVVSRGTTEYASAMGFASWSRSSASTFGVSRRFRGGSSYRAGGTSPLDQAADPRLAAADVSAVPIEQPVRS